MPDHGGNLNDAVRRYGRAHEDWLDLSTGINPHAYPVQVLTADVWHRLPEVSDTLLRAAQAYYGAPRLLAVAGTQAAIQALPRLLPPSRIVTATPAYAEHSHRWRQAGHAVREVAHDHLASAVVDCDVMVVCNPNNPTGATLAPDVLLQWAEQLAARGGCLIVDEAFGDTTPAHSVIAATAQPGLIVLRSVGKFFGLAGLRLGFVAAHPALLDCLADFLGPWTVSAPAQQIGIAALSDRVWQRAMREQLNESGLRLRQLLASHGIISNGCALFQYWLEPQAAAFADRMAQHGIWVRQFSHGIRIGLPPDENGWHKLDQALTGSII